jgi:hypothetical protein
VSRFRQIIFKIYLSLTALIALLLIALMISTSIRKDGFRIERRSIHAASPYPILERNIWFASNIPFFGFQLGHHVGRTQILPPSPPSPAPAPAPPPPPGIILMLPGPTLPTTFTTAPPTPFYEYLGFEFKAYSLPERQGWRFTLPNYFLFTLLLSPHLLIAISRLRPWYRHRHTPGLCPTCSYDLRAHSAGSRCPECGTPIPKLTTISP